MMNKLICFVSGIGFGLWIETFMLNHYIRVHGPYTKVMSGWNIIAGLIGCTIIFLVGFFREENF